jgi:dipeptidyl aminopeptidase/acylaminoacyl peptidase
MTSVPGTRLGVYEITALLGAGGMGEVYRARDTKLGREVAIKVLPSTFALDPDRLARFEREARLLASLNHPHIAQIYGVEESAGVVALVLELVEGETLAERIAKGSGLRAQGSGVPLADALAIARQIADALDAAHERGIVHRDLKPANILLTPDGVVKVLDFGLAKGAVRAGEPGGSGGSGGDEQLTHSPTVIGPTVNGVLLGTAPYMSPEQARGKAVDKRTDIWAFGCVLYEMLAGRRAFAGDTTSDTIAAILERGPDWSALAPGVPPPLRRLLAQCLEKDRRLRLRDIGDARLALDEAKNAREPEVAAQREPRGRERLAWLAFAVVVAALASYGTLAFRRTPAPPEIRFDLSFPPDVRTDFSQLALSPDGQRLVAAPAFGGRPPLWLRPLNSTIGRLLPGTEGASFPFWSPDGKSIAFFADQKLKRIDVEREAIEVVADAPLARGGAWHADGTILFAPNATGPLVRVPAAGGQPVPLTHLEKGQNDHRAPQFLPGGSHFLFYARGIPQVRGVYVARSDGSDARRLVGADAAAVYVSGHLVFARQGDLFAQRFDAQRLALDGEAFRVAERVAVNPGVSLASLSASASGALVYITGDLPRTRFAWLDRSGKVMETIGPEHTPLGDPALSPDGRHVAFSHIVDSNWDIWLMDLQGALTRFTSDPALDFAPIWSADGHRVFFQSTRGGSPDLYVRSVNAGTLEEVLLKGRGPKAPTDVTADGRILLYNQGTATTWQIWYLPLAGDSTPRPFVQTTFEARDGQFSPDGKWVAYQSRESGHFEIYLQPFPGPGERITVSAGVGQQVRWGRGGTELLYVAGDQRLTAKSVEFVPNGTIRLGTAVPLFPTRFDPAMRQQYAVSADGQRFLVNTSLEATDRLSMTLILNWKGKP